MHVKLDFYFPPIPAPNLHILKACYAAKINCKFNVQDSECPYITKIYVCFRQIRITYIKTANSLPDIYKNVN